VTALQYDQHLLNSGITLPNGRRLTWRDLDAMSAPVGAERDVVPATTLIG
jgi:hypothetical protein